MVAIGYNTETGAAQLRLLNVNRRFNGGIKKK
jgi:hypothetical protein